MMTVANPDAERAAEYVVSRVSEAAGHRLFQGAWKPALAESTLAPSLDLVATRRLRGVARPVAEGLVAWGRGARRMHLLREIPRPADVLAWQAVGERCVSILPAGADPAPCADGLAFAMHDLCHMEKFFDPQHHAGQVGFFAKVHAATLLPSWAAFIDRFDVELVRELEHVVADMNGSAVFLFAALKMKLKMAVRRKVARETGREVRVSGALDADEEAAFVSELSTLLDLLALEGETRDGGIVVSTRRDDPDAALRVLAHFESVGGATLARCRAVS